jgi:macrolide transport system ATP-binding/permease protein
MSAPLIELHGLSRRYVLGDQELYTLRDIDLEIRAGGTVALMGASGSGKSTLLNILGCLDRPSSRVYRVDGRETTSLDPVELAALRRDRFGFIFQRYNLLPQLTARANVEIPAIYAGVPEEARHMRARKLLARLGLGERLDHRPNQLSGGQQQRVSIARALMNGGAIILADEPTGALDSRTGREMMEVLLNLNRRGDEDGLVRTAWTAPAYGPYFARRHHWHCLRRHDGGAWRILPACLAGTAQGHAGQFSGDRPGQVLW